MNLSFKNTWFERLSYADLNNFFKDNFQATPTITNMHIIDNKSVLEIECIDLIDNRKFIVYMGEYGFYNLNQNDEFIFNPMLEHGDYTKQTINLAVLMANKNKNVLINNKYYNDDLVDFHKNKIAEFEKVNKESEKEDK